MMQMISKVNIATPPIYLLSSLVFSFKELYNLTKRYSEC